MADTAMQAAPDNLSSHSSQPLAEHFPCPRAPACPALQFGHIILTTSQGIMDHEEARRKKVGGKVLGFFY
jgi:ribosomal protein S8